MTPDELAALPRPLAFVLPGGGALGAYQVGVLATLAEAGLVPDLVVGVSAGALNAALYSWNHDADGMRRVDALWRAVRRRDLLRVHPGRLALAFAGLRPSFLDNRHGHAFLRRHLGGRRVEDAPIPLAIVASDLRTAMPAVLRDGEVVQAVLASTAFPAVYPPVRWGERWLIDGGVVADVPLDIAADLGAASALVVPVPPLAEAEPSRRAIDILLRASSMGVEAHGRTVLRRPPAGLTVVEVPASPSPLGTFSVGTAAAMIEAGRQAAGEWLRTPLRGPEPSI